MDDEKHLDYYEILGVPRDASIELIRKAYRDAARRFHPDLISSGSATRQDSQRFRRMTAAYHTLCDPRRKAAYDLKLRRAARRYQPRPAHRGPGGVGQVWVRKVRRRARRRASPSALLSFCLRFLHGG